MFSPQKHMSPFDVNMAADAGYKVIIPYINVTQDEVTGLVQDAIFSRPPHDGVRTGVFIGGKDALLALDMMASHSPHWTLRRDAHAQISLSPSVHSTTCGAHFIVRENRVHWA